MPRRLPRHAILAGCVSILFAAAPTVASAIDFGRDIRPILAKHCFKCHGPDENTREADLRLDRQTEAQEDLGGYRAVDPGKPDESEIIVRITSTDADLRMPPAESGPPLTANEIETLRKWISEGGEYRAHWSFRPTRQPAIPTVQNAEWCRGPIDRFVLHRLEQHGLSPSDPADKTALIRRVYLDLVGVTPEPHEVDAFVTDTSPDAFERVVDGLLASPDYGERFTRPWLDLARYSDTNGYEKDRERTIWPYRDWVIEAINSDMPFDQFSIEQLAGDMLPNATRQQRIATGFHRNTMLNEEGGIDPLEYRFHAMVDRVATTGTVWMGLTTGCAQCHTHKYDPITHTDYYALMALMNNADEPELSAVPEATRRQRRTIERQIENREKALAEKLLGGSLDEETSAAFGEWLADVRSQVVPWQTVSPVEMKSTMPLLRVLPDGSVLASGDATKRDVYTLQMPAIESDQAITAIRIEALPHPSLPATGPGLAFYEGRRGDFYLSELDVSVGDQPVELAVGTTTVPNATEKNGKVFPGNVFDGDGSTGWSIPGDAGQTHRVVIPLKEPIRLDDTWTIEMLFERHYVAGLGHFRIDVTTADAPVASEIDAPLQRRVAEAAADQSLGESIREELAIHFLRTSPTLAAQRKPIDQLRRSLPADVRTLVMKERPKNDPRETRRHHRGEYLQPKEIVDGNVPDVFEDGSSPTNRLELAEWLVSERNPLVGRVTANRAWREFFGTGIVRTAGDFGTQSEPPSHPDLIDWLDHQIRGPWNWSLKRLHREIVLSSTYRQAVGDAPASDPDNRLLSVFPYRRFDAERIRDSFLSAAGLLSREVGGKSVYPPQPISVVKLAWGNVPWPTSKGNSRYRRSLYTFSKRTAPFAAFTTFDAPSGEVCVARRDRSTTPLQALTLLNDAMYIEIADGLAESALRETGSQATADAIAKHLFRRILVREPSQSELDAIVSFYDEQSDHERPWMLVARVLMNTDEAITTP